MKYDPEDVLGVTLGDIGREFNDEFGEACSALYACWCRQDMLNGDFVIALEKEMDEIIDYITKAYKWVEKEETFTHKSTSLEEI